MSRSSSVLVLVALCVSLPLAADDGDLDSSFWSDGTLALGAGVDLTFGGLAADVDGSLAVAFSFSPADTELAYWESVGDSSLGSLCRVDPFPSAPRDTRIYDVAFDASGRLLALASAHEEVSDLLYWYVLAYSFPDCALVSGYGSGGVVALPGVSWPGEYGNQRLRPLADGTTLVAGWDTDTNHPERWPRTRVIHLQSNGAIGPIYRAPTSTFPDPVWGIDAAMAPNGHVVAIAQTQWNIDPSRDFLIVDFEYDGSVVTVLGAVTVTFDLGGDEDDAPTAVVATEDGRVVVVGTADGGGASVESSAAIAVLHWNSGGVLELDPSFSVDGKKVFTFASLVRNHLGDAAVQGDGTFLVAGHAQQGNHDYAMAVARLRLDGSFDSDFYPVGSGMRLVDFNDPALENDRALQVLLQNGRVVLAGTSTIVGGIESVGVARLLNSYVFADGFEAPQAPGWIWVD